MYGKQTEYAIAIMSCLSEIYGTDQGRLSAQEIANLRGLPKPFVSKTLTSLIQAGLVSGSRGPGGGCELARSPDTIHLYDVYRIFEREPLGQSCPFGGSLCSSGVGAACGIHHKLMRIQDALEDLLNTRFSVFNAKLRESAQRTPRFDLPEDRGIVTRQPYRAPTESMDSTSLGR